MKKFNAVFPVIAIILINVIIFSQVMGQKQRERRHRAELIQQKGSLKFVLSSNNARGILHTLEELRMGDTNSAIANLESALDSCLFEILGHYKEGAANESSRPYFVEQLEKIRGYRMKHPSPGQFRTTDSAIDLVLKNEKSRKPE